MAKKENGLTVKGIEEGIKAQEARGETISNFQKSILKKLKDAEASAGSAKGEASLKSPLGDTSITSNLVKILKEIKLTNTILQGIYQPKNKGSMSKVDMTEADIEQEKRDNDLYSILVKIEENTRPGGNANAADKTEDKGMGLLGWGTALALAIGTLLGLITAKLKAMQMVAKAITSTAKWLYNLFPESFRNSISKNLSKIPEFFKDLVAKFEINTTYLKNVITDTFKNKFPKEINAIEKAFKSFTSAFSRTFESLSKNLSKIPEFFKDLVAKFEINFTYLKNLITDTFKNKFSKEINAIEKAIKSFTTTFSEAFESLSKKFKGGGNAIIESVSKVFKSLGTAITKFFAPIGEAWATIMEFSRPVEAGVGKIQKFVSSIAEFFGKIVQFFEGVVTKFSIFGKVLGAFSKIVGKLAWPIMVIMGLYDSITAAIEGYKKDGILGGVEGFIQGLVKSIFTSFFDLIKDGISWILEKLGFDQAAKLLDSFSFESIFAKFIDAVFHPIDTIKSIFAKISKWFNDFEIPAIDFTVLGKRIAAGPWHPFKSDEVTKPVEAQPTTTGKVETKAPMTSTPSPWGPAYPNATIPAATKPTTPSPWGPAYPNAVAPTAGNKVYGESAKVDAAKTKTVIPAAPVVVSAPTTINKSSQNTMVKSPLRNPDNTLMAYNKTRFSQ